MLALSGTSLLKGEIAPPKTAWYGDHLNYEGVSILNKVPLPQRGLRLHSEDGLAYDITPVKFKMSTTLSKRPQPKREWYYKGTDQIVIRYCGDVADRTFGGVIYFTNIFDHQLALTPDQYGDWGILYSRVYIIARFKNTNIDNTDDYGISGEDGSIFFHYVEKLLAEL